MPQRAGGLYARGPTRNQRPDLRSEVAALEQYCQQYEMIRSDTIQDIGSGVNLYWRSRHWPFFVLLVLV